jgi:hypothetical protein
MGIHASAVHTLRVMVLILYIGCYLDYDMNTTI